MTMRSLVSKKLPVSLIPLKDIPPCAVGRKVLD